MFKGLANNFVYKFLLPFAKETTIHGVPLIVAPKLHPLERIFWVVVLISSAGGAIALTFSNWNRYNANPTVVSIQKDFRNWNNVLPSATGCYNNKTDPEAVAQYINETWGIDESHEKYHYYVKFIKVIADVSYNTLKDFAPFEHDKELNKINFLELAAKVHPKLTGTLVTFDTKRKSFWKLIMSEMGICFTVNNKFSDILTFKVKDVAVTKPNVDETLLKCHYLNGLCYARYDSDPQATINFYIHSYLDVIHATIDAPLYLRESAELEINYLMQETTAADELKHLTPAQRKCRFDNEPLTDDVSVYSTTICYINCRYRLALQLCGCRPFFYHFMAGKICNITGLMCLAKHAEHITRPPSQIGCQCPQPCELVTYLPLIPKITLWKSGYFDQRITFRWGIMHPTTKYRRDILFGFEDLVVSFGGTLALFLGTSFISFIEIIFFILEYLLSCCCCKQEITPKKIKNQKRMKKKDKLVKRKDQQETMYYIRVFKDPPIITEKELWLHLRPEHFKKL